MAEGTKHLLNWYQRHKKIPNHSQSHQSCYLENCSTRRKKNNSNYQSDEADISQTWVHGGAALLFTYNSILGSEPNAEVKGMKAKSPVKKSGRRRPSNFLPSSSFRVWQHYKRKETKLPDAPVNQEGSSLLNQRQCELIHKEFVNFVHGSESTYCGQWTILHVKICILKQKQLNLHKLDWDLRR